MVKPGCAEKGRFERERASQEKNFKRTNKPSRAKFERHKKQQTFTR